MIGCTAAPLEKFNTVFCFSNSTLLSAFVSQNETRETTGFEVVSGWVGGIAELPFLPHEHELNATSEILKRIMIDLVLKADLCIKG